MSDGGFFGRKLERGKVRTDGKEERGREVEVGKTNESKSRSR